MNIIGPVSFTLPLANILNYAKIDELTVDQCKILFSNQYYRSNKYDNFRIDEKRMNVIYLRCRLEKDPNNFVIYLCDMSGIEFNKFTLCVSSIDNKLTIEENIPSELLMTLDQCCTFRTLYYIFI